LLARTTYYSSNWERHDVFPQFEIWHMKKRNFNSQMSRVSVGLLAGVLVPGAAFACACGCGVFDVATSSMFPEGSGGTAYLNYDYQNQNHNWSGSSSAPNANNDDKRIETHFVTLGLQYMFNRSWGAQVELPFANRTFDNAGNASSLNWTSLGDIRLKAIYTGFSDDLSSGLTLGVKLPTGSYNHTEAMGDIDRDTQIGTGSTDLLLGGFHRDQFGSTYWNWFIQAELDAPVLKTGEYRPGIEADAAAGIYYDGLSLGRVKISPVAQIIGSWRGRDNGAAASPNDSGYQRILLSPGIEFNLHPVKFYADVEVPVYQNMTGNQLVAPVLFKVSLSYMF
jgi:hypothetical protein